MKYIRKGEPDIWRFFFLPLLIMFILFISSKNYLNKENKVITIKNKYSIERFGKENYYIVGDNKQIYSIKNLLFKSKINEKEFYENLKIGESYEIETTGYSISEFNSYKIINKFESIKEKEKKMEEEKENELIDDEIEMTPEMLEELSNNKGED